MGPISVRDRVERLIGGIDRHLGQFLRGKGEAHSRDRVTRAQPLERPVVEAAAVAQTEAAPVEGHKRHDQHLGVEPGAVFGHPRAERAVDHGAARAPFAKAQRLAGGHDDRHADRPVVGRHRRERVDLGPDRHVSRQNPPAMGHEPVGQKLGRLPLPRLVRKRPGGAGGAACLGLQRGDRHISTRLARPRKAKKPITSVSVVTKVPEASAGSRPSRLRPSGTRTPPRAATT